MTDLELSPHFITYKLCDLGRVLNLSSPFSYLQNGRQSCRVGARTPEIMSVQNLTEQGMDSSYLHQVHTETSALASSEPPLQGMDLKEV